MKKNNVPAPSTKKVKDAQSEEEPLPENGNNVFHTSNNGKYEGEWKRFDGVIKRHGKGIYSCPEFTYEGDFEEDQFHGIGVITFANGRKYTGQFENGQITGDGEMIFEDQSIYNGQWYQGSMHGIGTFSTINGETWKGRWCHGMSTCPIFPQVLPPQIEEEEDMGQEEENYEE